MLAGDPRITGVRTAVVRRLGRRGGGRHVDRHRRVEPRHRRAACRCWPWPPTATRPRPATASSVGREPAELDVDEAAADAVERATRLLGARKISSRRLPLVLEPRMAATVLGIVAGTLTGGPVVKGRSPFADRVGETIASPLLTLVDDPTDHRSLGADSHDGEGLATRRNVLDRRRRARRASCSTATPAGASGRPSTGSAVRGRPLDARRRRAGPGRRARRPATWTTLARRLRRRPAWCSR